MVLKHASQPGLIIEARSKFSDLLLTMPAKQYHTFVDFTDGPLHRGVVVPQEVYAAPAGQNFSPQPPLSFSVNGVLGVRLEDALRQPVLGLADGDVPPNIHISSTRLTLRVSWPGYHLSNYQGAIQLFDNKNHSSPRNLTHIAYQIAKCIQTFYNEQSRVTGADAGWQLSRYPFERLYLLQLRQVANGSWQPVLSVDIP
ncbi:hypothetical protein PHLGIDRAFT_119015 [Phlebiopsis gigantea 11061_1 CR5-6]|uniref:Uncharacterized protein n=1 Tax=Phlebiopsis gigantea (strain 11061_1 CR5-6) TaxID=745531 RepID=A0A0C3S6T6_PHLG1|nr:hypothetical protein PHLGIDRAFT_119015 [Phlebiopsis gigantea 11061_1 CR5-6]